MDYFDLHCDTAYECYKRNLDLNNRNLAVNNDFGDVFNNWKQCFAIWIKDDIKAPFELYKKILNNFKKLQKRNNLTPIMTVEGGAVIEDKTERIDQLKNDGISALTLTWNGENRIGGGAFSDAPLTDFGRAVINRLNKNKMFCDLSHINEKGFYKAIEIADYPFASHSCCRAICDHKRNLYDEQLKLIAQKNGVIGICFYPIFLGGQNVFEKIYENIYHMLLLDLENSICIGSDFDGAEMSDELKNISAIPKLYGYLSSRGINDKSLNKIFYTNADNFFFDKR